jgi:hypothetical protein
MRPYTCLVRVIATMFAETLLGCAAVLGATALCGCTAWFDGAFPSDADSLPDLTPQAAAGDSTGGEVQSDGGGPSDASMSAAGDSTVGGSVANDAAEEGPLGDAVNLDDSAGCTGDLSDIGTNDFGISFTVKSVEGALVALANQRGACGPSVFWDVRMSDGFIYVEVDDRTNYTTFTTSSVRVNDGRPHDVVIQRSAEVVVASVDGVRSAAYGATASLGKLAPVMSGTDVCASNDMTAALVGTLSNLCVTSP